MHTCLQYIRKVEDSAYRALELADMSQDGSSDYPDDIEDYIFIGSRGTFGDIRTHPKLVGNEVNQLSTHVTYFSCPGFCLKHGSHGPARLF